MNTFQTISRKKKVVRRKPIEETTLHEENYKDFLKWYQEFTNNFGTSASREHSDGVKKWFDNVQEGHLDLRKIIGGVALQGTIDFAEEASSTQRDLSEDPHIKQTLDSIVRAVPGYLTEYGLDRKDLMATQLPAKFKGMRPSKHVIGYITRNPTKFSPATSDYVNTYFANLGDQLKRMTNPIKETNFYFTTEAKSFPMLGHYGPDAGSCFSTRAAGTNGYKYNLGLRPHSFVLLGGPVGTTDFYKIDNPALFFRSWGWYNVTPRYTSFNLCNMYPNHKATATPETCVQTAMVVASLMMKVDKDDLTVVRDNVQKGPLTRDQRGIYLNGGSVCITHKDTKLPVQEL